MELSRKQRAVMGLLHKYGDDPLNEGNVIDDLWPLIQRPRDVCAALVRRGLVSWGDWSDEYGYEIRLTDSGREWLDPQSVTSG